MNKVTSYLKNVGKSVAYATMDFTEKTWIPEVYEFKETNRELFKAVYATVSHSKQSIEYGKRLARESQIYKDINTGIDNVIEDIKTGKFYNKERSDAGIDAAGEFLAGGGFDDFGDDFNFDDWDDDGSLDDFSDNDEPSSVTKGDLVIADSVAKSGNLSAQLISKTVASTSSNIIKTTMATTNMTMAQNVELVAGIRTSIAGVHESINSLLKFATEAIPTQTNIQSQFFTDSIAVMKESNAILKEMLEMQRNVYKQQQEEFKSKNQFSNVFSGGTLDLTEYAKAIWKNTKGLDKTGSLDMLFSDMGGSTMLGQMLTNPLGGLVTGIVTSFMPGNVVKQVASFSKTLGNIFPVMISRLNKWKKDDKGGLYTLLGNIFGLETDTKKTIDPSKYNKGAVPFDGITRKAIVDVIPEHLAKIESLLSGTSQRTYDYESGKWINYKDIKKKKEQEEESLIKSAFFELQDDINAYKKSLRNAGGLTADSEKELEKNILKMMKEVIEGDEIFSPEQIKHDYQYDDLMRGLGDYLSKNVPLSKLMSVAANAQDTRSRIAKNAFDAESKGYDIFRKLVDNSNNDNHLKYNSEFPDYVEGNKASINLLNIKDSSGYNVLNYLKEILVNVSYIREFGGSGVGKKRKGGKPYAFDSYAKGFDKTYVSDDIIKEREKKKAKDDYYYQTYTKDGVDEEEAAGIANIEGLRKHIKNPFSDLDEDEFKNVGKYYKEETEWMRKMSKIKGNTLSEKWKNAYTAEDKRILIKGTIDKGIRSPINLLSETINKANRSIYNFLFKAETDEEDIDGEKIKGFFNAMLAKMRGKWDELTTTIDEKFITPLVKKYGLDEKWENLKNKVRNSKPMDMLRNAKDRVGSALFKDLHGMYSYTKNSVSDVLGPVFYDKNFAKARVEGIKSRYQKANANDIENLKRELTGLSDEEIQYIKENAPPNFLKMIQEAGFNKGGTGVVEQGGSIQVSEGEIVHVERPNGSGITEDRKKELDNALKQWIDDYANGRSVRTRSSFAKVRRINERARKYNSTIVSDTLNKGKEQLKSDFIDPLKARFDSFVGVEGSTEKEREESIKKEKKTLLGTVGKIIGEMSGEGASTVSKAIIGGGLGLLSGIVGGPLIGASVGAAASFIKNSKTINEAVFGKDRKYDENGVLIDKKGGLISKDIQNAFKKYIPDMGKFGAVGAVGSLLLPFGPLAGAAIGAGIGLAKNSETMNKMIFGEEITNEDGSKSKKGGLLTKERLDKIKELFPRAAVGAGIGSVASLFGPFGILGSAAIGAGAGLLTGTEEFKELIFGEDDGEGNRFGGIKGALQEYFIDPIKNFGINFKEDFFGFIKESMIDPLNDAITPITTEIAYWSKKLVFGLPKWLGTLGKEHIGVPLMNLMDSYIMRPISNGLKSLFGGLFSRAKGLVSLPFRMVGGLGNLVRGHQIKAGRDAGSAKDRLQFAKDKGINKYDYKQFDETLAGASQDDLEELTARTGMLAHGAEYFDKELKKSRQALNRVLADYYKLGWFSKDKKSYNRIREYIRLNDIEAAIDELTNIQEIRTSGGPLNKDANDAIARFAKANKNYQVARDNKIAFGNINESENAEWMEKKFGKDWKKNMDAKKLFDYSRRELSRATSGAKNVSKGDLFKDPTAIISKGEAQINDTLMRILDVMTNPSGKFRDKDTDSRYDVKVTNATNAANNKIEQEKAKLKEKFAKFGYSDKTISLLYENKKIHDLILNASAQGINYDDATIEKLSGMKLSNREVKLLKKFPYVAMSSATDIKKNLDFTRNNHATFTTNAAFGARAVRNANLDELNKANKIEYHDSQYGPRKYIKDENGEISPDMSDADTKESFEREQEDRESKKTFMSSVTGLKDSVLRFFGYDKNNEPDKGKEPWYKQFFNFDLGSKIKMGGSILALLTGVGALKSLWNNREPGGVLDTIGSKVSEHVSPVISKITNWITNKGEYAPDKGSIQFMDKYIYPNLVKGIGVLLEYSFPALASALISSIPTLIKSALKGVSKLFGWTKDVPTGAEVRIPASSLGISDSGNSTTVKTAKEKGASLWSRIFGTAVKDPDTESSDSGTESENKKKYDIESLSEEAIGEVDGIGKVYTKDEDGNMIDASGTSVKDIAKAGGFYDESGKFYKYDEYTGEFVNGSDSYGGTKGSPGKELAKRLGYNATRSILTGTKAGMFGKVTKSVVGGVDNVLGKFLPYKIGAAPAKAVVGAFEKASLGTRVVNKVADVETKQNSKFLTKFIGWLDTAFSSLFKSNKVKSAIKKAMKMVGKEVTDESFEKISKKIVSTFIEKVKDYLSSANKLVANLVEAGAKKVFTIAFAVLDFVSGMDRAEAILGIKEPNFLQTVIAGLINVAVNWFFFGLIDSSTVTGWFIDIIFPLFGIDMAEIKKLRSQLTQEVAEYNAANPEDQLTEEEYLDNNGYTTWGKIKQTFSLKKSNNKTKTYNTSGTTYNRGGRNKAYESSANSYAANYGGRGTRTGGFVSQLDPKYKSKKFNISGDTEYQTLGDSGCAPATAANILNFYRGQGSTMDDASNAALKYKDINGGVTPDYFSNYLGKNGINTYSTNNKKELLSGISSGKPTVLLGMDPTNKANTPYGAGSSHYVLATGLDGKGNVIIQDPESRKPNALYPVKDVIRQSEMGVITSSGRGTDVRRSRSITSRLRPKFKNIGFGRGGNAQHQDLAKWSPLSNQEIDSFIKRMNPKSPFTGAAINAAAKASGLDPRYILAHAAVESAWGVSYYGKNYHNYFGIGAFDSNPDNAKNYGNSGMVDGLIQGAKWIRANYYDAGQTTVYKMRYSDSGTHNYCTSTTWVGTIASIMEAMPPNTSATYHKSDNSGITGVSDTSSSKSSSNNVLDGLFSAFKTDVLNYYGPELTNIFWGNNDTGAIDYTPSAAVDANGSAQAVIQTALAEVGYKATASNGNKYGKEYGLDNQPWCAIFLWWVFKNAGCPEQFYGGQKSAYCPDILNYYRKHGQLVDINEGQAGDIVFFNWSGGTTADHVGLIQTNNNNGSYTTVEGNTGTHSQSNGGEVKNPTRYTKNIVAIARPNYAETGSGKGIFNKNKSVTYFNPNIKTSSKSGKIAASIMSGRGTNKTKKYINDVLNNKSVSSNNILTRSNRTNVPSITHTGMTKLSGRATTSLPSLASPSGVRSTGGVSAVASNNSSTVSSIERLLTVIVEILQIIANNSEKLSDIVTLLSKSLNLDLTNDDISKLSSNNAQIKNKIANALKTQGSANGLGNSTMNASTESLAAAMYSIARA